MVTYLLLLAFDYGNRNGICPVYRTSSFDDAIEQFYDLTTVEEEGVTFPIPEPYTIEQSSVEYPAFASGVTVLKEETILGADNKHLAMVSLIAITI